MDPLETVLENIRQKPRMYLGETDIDRLHAFLSGYVSAAKQADLEFDDEILGGFSQYLAEKFQDARSLSWCGLIKEHCPEQNGVEVFFRLLDEYHQDEISAVDRLFQKSALIPVVVQDWETKDVLMVGFTDREAVELTLETKTAWFWSRSRQELWNKGATSGNYLHVKKIVTDCDTDTLLYICAPDGPTCHTGARSCFFHLIWEEDTL